MARQTKNYARFFTAFNRVKWQADPEECRRALILQYTDNRTDSLREMTAKEYKALCEEVENMAGIRDRLRRERSITLKLMQELEVDTTDWAQINDFCRHPRIAGKEFGRLTIEEHNDLQKKLRSIKRKGWTRRKDAPEPAETPAQRITYLINLAGNGTTIYN